jgi:di/tricarboxylate transporter
MELSFLSKKLMDNCPCLQQDADDAFGGGPFYLGQRRLADEEKADPPVWQTVVVAITIFVMFVFMLTHRIGPDWVMVAGLTLFMLCEIVTIKEGLQGFANEGILTVMVLFVVAEGVSRTGALDYYMGLSMGKPKTVAGAQIRLLVPIAILSAFF